MAWLQRGDHLSLCWNAAPTHLTQVLESSFRVSWALPSPVFACQLPTMEATWLPLVPTSVAPLALGLAL